MSVRMSIDGIERDVPDSLVAEAMERGATRVLGGGGQAASGSRMDATGGRLLRSALDALPVAGGLAGGALGMAGGPAAPASVPLGAGLGTMGGMELRRLLGGALGEGEDFSLPATLAGGALAAAVPGAPAMGSAVASNPGLRAGGAFAREMAKDIPIVRRFMPAVRAAKRQLAPAAPPAAPAARTATRAARPKNVLPMKLKPKAPEPAAPAGPTPNPKAHAELMARKQRGASKRTLEARAKALNLPETPPKPAPDVPAVRRPKAPPADPLAQRLKLSVKLEQEMAARGMSPLEKLEARRALAGRVAEIGKGGTKTLTLSPLLTQLLSKDKDE